MGLRQRLREKASGELHRMEMELHVAADKLRKGIPGISVADLLKLAAGGRTGTLRHGLVTAMTNHLESELEKHYNRQQDLLEEPPFDKEGKDKGKSK